VQDVDWRLLETFVHVARAGSLTAAAREIGISQPTASRHVQELEEQLDVTLFVRHARGLKLTERGSELLGVARELDDNVQLLLRRASGLREAPRGVVRLTVNEPIGVHAMPACYALLRERFPEIRLEVVIDNRVQNLSRREADLAVRMFRPTQLDLIAKPLGEVHVSLYADRCYLQRHGTPTSVDDARQHTLIGFDREASWAGAIAELGLSPADFAFRTDSILAQVQAVVAGVGIGPVQDIIAARHDNLVRVVPELRLGTLPLWLVMHRDARGDAAVRAVFETVAEFLTGYCAQGEG
jgi:DNA-binding transcriptional LysR family regulator